MYDGTVVLELAGDHKLARDLVAGGVFVPGYNLALNEECELVLRGADATELRIAARVVWSDASGIGLQLHDCNAELKQRIAALANPGSAPQEPDEPTPAAEAQGDGPAADEPDASTEEGKHALTMHERLRHLPLAQQLKVAHHGELAERIQLERLYGKNVWEALLRNPRITGPEVARIARMGALPRPLLEIIIGNGAWVQIPEVRRALLANTRLGTDHIMRILRLLPKHELKLAAFQTAYSFSVRDVAKRLIKESGGG